MDADPGAVPPGRAARGALHMLGCLVGGQRSRLEPWAVRGLRRDPVGSESTPGVPINPPGGENTAAAPDDEPLGLGSSRAQRALVVDVVEAQSFAGADPPRDPPPHRMVDGSPA